MHNLYVNYTIDNTMENLRLAAKDTCPYVTNLDPTAAAKSDLLSDTLVQLSLQEGAPSIELLHAMRVTQMV